MVSLVTKMCDCNKKKGRTSIRKKQNETTNNIVEVGLVM